MMAIYYIIYLLNDRTNSISLPMSKEADRGMAEDNIRHHSADPDDDESSPPVHHTVSPPPSLSSPLLKEGESRRREKQQKTALIVMASCSIFAFAGSFYGWGPMQLLLEDNGNFGTECTADPDSAAQNNNVVCPEQTAALLNCRFVSQLTVLTGPLLGYISDRYGGSTLTCCMGISIVSGLALLLAAVKFPGTVWDSILYLAFLLMGLGATSGGLLTVETGLLFRDHGTTTSKTQSRVISLLNALFDAGAMTYLGLWGLEKVTTTRNNTTSSNANLMSILGVYLGIAVVVLASYAWFFRQVMRNEERHDTHQSNRRSISTIEQNTEKVLKENGMDRTDCTLPCRRSSSDIMPRENVESDGIDAQEPNSDLTHLQGRQKISRLSSPSEDVKEEQTNDEKDSDGDLVSVGSAHPPTNGSVDATYVPISQRKVAEQLKSQAYVLLCVLFSFHMVSNVWTLTTARDFLKHLGDDEYGNRYLSIFTLMTPVSLVALPFEDVAIHKYGFAWALQGVNFLGILHGIVKVASTDLNVQIVGFVIFSFFRCFLFAVTFSCLATFTSSHATGRAVGIMYVVSGAASFVNIGFANLAVERMDGDFFVPNMVFVVLTFPMIYIVNMIGKALDRDDCSKTNPEAQSLVSLPEDLHFVEGDTRRDASNA